MGRHEIKWAEMDWNEIEENGEEWNGTEGLEEWRTEGAKERRNEGIETGIKEWRKERRKEGMNEWMEWPGMKCYEMKLNELRRKCGDVNWKDMKRKNPIESKFVVNKWLK